MYKVKIPTPFFWRRLHSLTGLWLVGFLIIHLLTNSQAAMPVGSDASGFITAANNIRELPYILVVEIILIAIPFLIHIVWGIQYLRTGQYNSIHTDGTSPELPEYPRNRAYTWQRLTSWILLFLVAIHVIQMRFLEEPVYTVRGADKFFLVKVHADKGLYPLAERLGVQLFDADQIAHEKATVESFAYSGISNELLREQRKEQNENWIKALEERPIGPGELIASSANFGTAELLMVRETFKIPAMLILYTVLVVSACFHAFNGLWTFMITWGVTLTPHSQNRMRSISTFLMFLVGFLGLAAVWGTYFINLYQ